MQDKANAVADSVKNYYQDTGADPNRITVQEGKGIGPGTQYHVVDTDPNTGVETKLADINYQEKTPPLVTIDGVQFEDYKSVLQTKLGMIESGDARPEVIEKAKTDVALIQKAEEEYGVGVPVPTSHGLRINLGNPDVPSSYYVPERNIEAILTNRPIPDSIFKNPSDVATFQKSLDNEAVGKAEGIKQADGSTKPSANPDLEANLFRKYTDLFYTLKNSNLAPLQDLNIDIEGHPLESQAMQEVLTRPENKGLVLIEGSNVGSIAFRDFRGSGDVDTVGIGNDPSASSERIVQQIVDRTNELYGRTVYKMVAEEDGSFTAQRISNADAEALDHITTMKPQGQTTVSAEDKEYNEVFRKPLGVAETNRYLEAEGVKALQPSELEGRKIATAVAPRQFNEDSLPNTISPSLQKIVDYLKANVGEGGTFIGSLGRGTDTGDTLFPNKDVGDSLVLAKSLSDRYYGGQLNDEVLSIAQDQVTRGFITQAGYDALATQPITELEDRQGITADIINGFNDAIQKNVVTPEETTQTTPTETQTNQPTVATTNVNEPQQTYGTLIQTPSVSTAPIASTAVTPSVATAPTSTYGFGSVIPSVAPSYVGLASTAPISTSPGSYVGSTVSPNVSPFVSAASVVPSVASPNISPSISPSSTVPSAISPSVISPSIRSPSSVNYSPRSSSVISTSPSPASPYSYPVYPPRKPPITGPVPAAAVVGNMQHNPYVLKYPPRYGREFVIQNDLYSLLFPKEAAAVAASNLENPQARGLGIRSVESPNLSPASRRLLTYQQKYGGIPVHNNLATA